MTGGHRTFVSSRGLSILACAVWLCTSGMLRAFAAVPNEHALPAYAEEQTILQFEQGVPKPGWGDAASGVQNFDRHYVVPPGKMPEQDVVLQRGGNFWRGLHNGPMAIMTATILIAVLVLIAAFYAIVGPTGTRDMEATGRTMLRFTLWQRIVHWATAIDFVVLALTGLIVLFGKKVLMPWMGHDAFSWLAIVSKWLHNVAGPIFVVLTVLMFATFVAQNYFRRGDWNWLRRLGGMATHRHVPADYFNAGEKVWFWGAVTLLGLLMMVTGLMLDFPYFGDVGASFGLTRYQLQWADFLHIAGAALYITGALGHIYLGTIGTPGAWHAMRYGTVDEAWARAHHELWYDDVKHGRPAPPRGHTQPIVEGKLSDARS